MLIRARNRQGAGGREVVGAAGSPEQALHISPSTAKFRVAGLMTRTGARTRVQLVIWAYETGRVRP